jgi:hypothetical protein
MAPEPGRLAPHGVVAHLHATPGEESFHLRGRETTNAWLEPFGSLENAGTTYDGAVQHIEGLSRPFGCAPSEVRVDSWMAPPSESPDAGI